MSKKYFAVLLAFPLLLSLAYSSGPQTPAESDAVCRWQPGDLHKMHFPQLPDAAGWDVNATQPMVLGDDFRCTESGPIKDIHFWGSWKNGVVGQISSFMLSIYSDIPVGPTVPYSRPGQLLWERMVTSFELTQFDPTTSEGWYDPATGEKLFFNHQQYFQYDVCFDNQADWFIQEQGKIYWLTISAVVVQGPVTAQWGWKSSLDRFNDDAVYIMPGMPDWVDMWEPQQPLANDFSAAIDPNGNFLGGFGQGAYGDGWYFYPQDNWWNIWFYDHPFSNTRRKIGDMQFFATPIQPGLPSDIEVAVNWSTDRWSIDQPPLDSAPPLPGVDEALYIGRTILYSGPATGQPIGPIPYLISGYNPEWISVDIRGRNVNLTGRVVHECQPSLNLAFVITNTGSDQPEACCLPDGNCIMLPPGDCIAQGGHPQGAGTVCTTPLACCISNAAGTICLMVDPLCCDDMNGTSLPAGTICLGDLDGDGIDDACEPQEVEEACCLPSGDCVMVLPSLCTAQGGVPQGPGTKCSTYKRACCLPDGSCVMADPLCCEDMGGTPSPYSVNCQGDKDGNHVDDACENPPKGACCLTNGTCVVTTAADCQNQGGVYHGDGTSCLGDLDGDGIDERCKRPWQDGDTIKMHFPQLPDPTGWNVMATYPHVLADDFRCIETGWIKDVHFWGSWLNDQVGEIGGFILSFHSDVPKSPTNLYSHPGQLLWEKVIPFNRVKVTSQIFPGLLEGWYDPSTGVVLPNNHPTMFQYDVLLDTAEWFWQDSGKVYWLNISARVANIPGTVPHYWGWKSTQNHFNDDAVRQVLTTICVDPDNGTGTVDLPPDCPYTNSPDNPMKMINGLPPGSPIECDAFFDVFYDLTVAPGGSLGGEVEQYKTDLTLEMRGMGELSGFSRSITLPAVQCDVHVGPRTPGMSPQDIETEMFMMQGQAPIGDPDFDLLRIRAGTGFGMPSPGHTTLIQQPGGNWEVDSFFDITYRVDFVGKPGGSLGGMSGSTTATIRIKVGPKHIKGWVDLYEPPNFTQSLDLAFVITGGYNCDCQPGDANGDGNVNVGDAVYLINLVFKNGANARPYRICSGDANCDCTVNIADAVFVINMVFKNGPRPCSCSQWLTKCGPPLRF